MPHAHNATAIDDRDVPTEVSQLVDHFHSRDRQLVDRDEQLAQARAAFRKEREAEREKLAAERAEIDRLKRETQALNREATRTRDRVKKLAVRHERHVEQKWAAVRAELGAKQAAIDEARGQFSAESVRFEMIRSEFHAGTAEETDRLREAWGLLEAHRKRAAAERTETNEFNAKQEAALAARTAEFIQRERAIAGTKSNIESTTAALRQEAAGLETRAVHARGVVEELEKKRDELHAELLALAPRLEAEPTGEYRVPLDRAADHDLTKWVAELDAQDRQLFQEKANLAKVKASLDREALSLADQRKVLAEQFALLGAARSEWQEVEGRTMAEMEELAQGLRRREDELASREDRVASADGRRREETEELGQQRAQLETWQSKLTMVSRMWHAERERREQHLALRMQSIAAREATLGELFERWEHAREDERERLRTELQLWADDRARMTQAAQEYDRRTRDVLSELTIHAARAMASEDLLAETIGKGKGTTRRFTVLNKRWEKVFAKHLVEIDARRTAMAEDLSRLDERYEEIHRSLQELSERESELNGVSARTQMALLGDPDEVLPWASEEVESDPEPVMLQFSRHARAA